MKYLTVSIIVLSWAAGAMAQSTRPDIKLETSIEDGKKNIVATITLNGKPIEAVTVQIFATRTFGIMLLGQDTTLDDGTAAVLFPNTLPVGSDGMLDVIAVIKGPDQYANISATATFPGAPKKAAPEDPFPSALWAPHAPWQLLLTIGTLLAGVWTTYAFVVFQIRAIAKGT